MADDRIEIEIILDDGSIVKGFQKINQEAEKSADAVERSLGRALRRPLNTSGIDRSLSRLTSGVFNFRNALIGAVGILGGAALVRSFAEAASIQQDAVNALNTSLQTAGEFSREASVGFQELASELQATSTFGDEVILGQIALARNFTKTNEEAGKLTRAAVELSAATGISLDSAVKNLGKTFSGLAGELGESVPALRNLTQEQLKAGEALDLVLNRFGGSAIAQTRTFSGALAQLSNTFGDLFEEIGSVITNSPVIISLFNALSQTFRNLSGNLSGGNLDQFFKNLVINAAAAVNAIIDSFELVNQIPNFFRFVFLTVEIETSKFVQRWLATIQPVAGFVDRIFGNPGESQRILDQNFKAIDKLERQLEMLGKTSIQTSGAFQAVRAEVDNFITNFQNNITNATAQAPVQGPLGAVVETVDKDLVKLREKLLEAQGKIRADVQSIFFNADDVFADNADLFGSLADKGIEDLKKLQEGLTQFKQTTIAQAVQIQNAVTNGIGRSIASGIQGAVTALQKGENAISAFAKSFIGVIGDLSIQLGTQLIVAGIGLQQLFSLNPAGAIAFGVALVAIGTLLKGFAGGGASSSIPSGQDAVTSPVLDGGAGGATDGLQDPGSRVQVTIQGDVLDGDETGLRIADILKEQGFQNAVIT